MNCGTTAVFLARQNVVVNLFTLVNVVPSVRFELTLDGF